MEAGAARSHRDTVIDLATQQCAQNPTRVVTAMYQKVMDQTRSQDRGCPLLQSTRSSGHQRLVEIIAKMYSKLINRHIDPYTEVLATLGSNHALSCAILGLIKPDIEVIVMEPCSEYYTKLIKSARAHPRFATFKKLYNASIDSYELFLDDEVFESLFSENTYAVILNNPNSPTGKVFTLFELHLIAHLCIKWNVICISDEAYEWQVYQPRHHFRIASLPNMWKRTVTIGSGGQSFGVTGWAVGWIYGPTYLISFMTTMHHMTAYSGCTLMQETVARLLEKEFRLLGKAASQFNVITSHMQRKRNFMFNTLKMVNFQPILPWAGGFLMADWSWLGIEVQVDINTETGKYKDFRFAKWLTRNVGIRGVPASLFSPSKGMQDYICFSFVSNISNLQKAKKKFMEAFLEPNQNCLCETYNTMYKKRTVKRLKK